MMPLSSLGRSASPASVFGRLLPAAIDADGHFSPRGNSGFFIVQYSGGAMARIGLQKDSIYAGLLDNCVVILLIVLYSVLGQG